MYRSFKPPLVRPAVARRCGSALSVGLAACLLAWPGPGLGTVAQAKAPPSKTLAPKPTSSAVPVPSLAQQPLDPGELTAIERALHHAQPVSLQQVEAWAQQHAPALKLAREERKRGDAALVGARVRVQQNPTVSALVGPRVYAHTKRVATDVQVSLSQELEVNGEPGARRRLADRHVARLAAQEQTVKWQVHAAVHDAFHRALLARERVEVHQRILAFQQRLCEIAKRRLEAGDASPLVVRIAEGELALERVHLLVAQQALQQRAYELAQVVGWPRGRLPLPAGELDPPQSTPALATLLEIAKKHHPELLTKREVVKESQAQAELADREGAPKPQLFVQAQREGALAGQSQYIFFSGLSLALPFFQRNQGARALAHSEVDIAHAQADVLQSTVFYDIDKAQQAVEATAARLRIFSRDILPNFEENLRLLQREYELGEIDILTVGIGRERFLRGQDDALAAYGDYYQAVATLEALIGQELWPEEQHTHEGSQRYGDPATAKEHPHD